MMLLWFLFAVFAFCVAILFANDRWPRLAGLFAVLFAVFIMATAVAVGVEFFKWWAGL